MEEAEIVDLVSDDEEGGGGGGGGPRAPAARAPRAGGAPRARAAAAAPRAPPPAPTPAEAAALAALPGLSLRELAAILLALIATAGGALAKAAAAGDGDAAPPADAAEWLARAPEPAVAKLLADILGEATARAGGGGAPGPPTAGAAGGWPRYVTQLLTWTTAGQRAVAPAEALRWVAPAPGGGWAVDFDALRAVGLNPNPAPGSDALTHWKVPLAQKGIKNYFWPPNGHEGPAAKRQKRKGPAGTAGAGAGAGADADEAGAAGADGAGPAPRGRAPAAATGRKRPGTPAGPGVAAAAADAAAEEQHPTYHIEGHAWAPVPNPPELPPLRPGKARLLNATLAAPVAAAAAAAFAAHAASRVAPQLRDIVVLADERLFPPGRGGAATGRLVSGAKRAIGKAAGAASWKAIGALPARVPPHADLEPFVILGDDPRVGLRGQCGVRVRPSKPIPAFSLLGFYAGLQVFDGGEGGFKRLRTDVRLAAAAGLPSAAALGARVDAYSADEDRLPDALRERAEALAAGAPDPHPEAAIAEAAAGGTLRAGCDSWLVTSAFSLRRPHGGGQRPGRRPARRRRRRGRARCGAQRLAGGRARARVAVPGPRLLGAARARAGGAL